MPNPAFMRAPPLLAFVAGIVSATGFAPLGLWPLTIAAFAVLTLLVGRARSVRSALWIGWLFGLGQFLLGLNWIATAFTYQAAMPAWLGWVAVLLLSLYLAVYPALAAGVARGFGGGRALPTMFWLAGAWIVTEWLRGVVFTGFPWNPVGVALVDLSVAQSATLIGTYGLSGLVVLLGGALLAIVTLPGWRKALAIPLLLLVAVDLLPAPAPQDGVRVHVAQPNISQAEKWVPGYEARNRARLEAVSGAPTLDPRLLLWPEAAIPDYLEEEPFARRDLATLLGPSDLLLTGGTALEFDPATGRVIGARNGVFAMDPQGRLLARYDKAHLTPYGEYLPMRWLLEPIGLSRLAPGDFDFWPGEGPRTLALPGFGAVGLQICYEIIFSGGVVDPAARPDFIFNPSNDAWFGAFGPPQHLAQARLRAIEEGLPIVRSTPTGISALIDAHGRVLSRVPAGVPGVIQARMPLPLPPTLFARAGNVLPLLFAGMLIGLAVVSARRGR